MTGEKKYERQLTEEVRARGGLSIKQTAEYHRGIPDRLLLLPGGRVEWVELKSDGKKPTKLQRLTHERLQAVGQKVTVIDSEQALQNFLKTI